MVLPTKPLYKHQEETVAFKQHNPRVFDTSDPGTGKTRAHLHTYNLLRNKDPRAALVIAPKTLLDCAWENDIREFYPHLTYSIAYAENRQAAFDAKANIYLTNTDAAKWLAKRPPAFFKRFSTLIVDESADYKHRTSQRSKALVVISRYFDYISLLTGTPNSNTVCDIWHQAFILDRGKRLGPSFFHFRSAVCEAIPKGNTQYITWHDREGAEETVAMLLSDISIRHEFDKCVDIPPTHQYQVTFKMSAAHRRIYEKLREEAIIELSNVRITAINASSVKQKLLQVASGAVYTDAGGYKLVDTARYELVCDLIKGRKHSVVFYMWKHQRDELIRQLTTHDVKFAVIDGDTPRAERTKLVAGYQREEYQTILMHPKTGAHGLTLTKGTAVIWASPSYLADYVKQGMHRIRRAGQKQKTEVIEVAALGTVDAGVYESTAAKGTRMKNFLDILKESR